MIDLEVPVLLWMILVIIHPASGQEEQNAFYYGLRTFLRDVGRLGTPHQS